MKLGKKPYRHDPRTLLLEDYVDGSHLPLIPASYDQGTRITDWPMLANDRLGDCTSAGAGHAVQTFVADSRDVILNVTDTNAINFYELFGYNPDDPNTDQGANELDVLRVWSKVGYPVTDAAGTVDKHRIAAYTLVNPRNMRLQKAAIYLFGGLYSGVALPAIAQEMGDHWMLPSDLGDPYAQPGSWGGHCVWTVSYDANGVKVVSWGQLITVDWNFIAHYFDEQWAILSSQDWLNGTNSPQGFNWQQLTADLAVVRA